MKRLAIALGMIFIAALAIADDTFVEKRFVATVDSDGVQRVSLLAGEYFFDPNVIVVKVNVPVELSARKEPGITPHDITLKAPEAGMDFKTDLSKEPKLIKFTPTKTGTYPFECAERFLFFKSHKDRGMHGVFEVVAQDQTPDRQMTDQPTTTAP